MYVRWLPTDSVTAHGHKSVNGATEPKKKKTAMKIINKNVIG